MKRPPQFPPVAREIQPFELGKRTSEQFAAVDRVITQIELPDLLPDGTVVPGNIPGEIVKVSIDTQNIDIPVAHHQKRVLRNWWIVGRRYLDSGGIQVDPTAFVDIRDGHRAAGVNVTYLRATFASPIDKLVLRVFLFGAS